MRRWLLLGLSVISLTLMGPTTHDSDRCIPACPTAGRHEKPTFLLPYEPVGWGSEANLGQNPYWVTVATDGNGHGTLRDAVSEANRYIRFDCDRLSTTDWDPGSIEILSDNTTIDGSGCPIKLRLGSDTAAPNSQFIKIGSSAVSVSNIVIRNIRLRLDGATNGLQIYNADKVVIDHVSCSWATDQCIDIGAKASTREVTNVTIQHSIIAEVLDTHSFASLLSGKFDQITFYRNLFVHNQDRNPQIVLQADVAEDTPTSGQSRLELVQNVVYNYVYGHEATNEESGTSSWPSHITYIQPLFDPHTAPSPKIAIRVYAPNAEDETSSYVVDPSCDERWAGSGDECECFRREDLVLAACAVGGEPTSTSAGPTSQTWTTSYSMAVAADRASLLEEVVAEAGPRPLDVTDSRLVADIRNGTGDFVVTPPVGE